MNIRLKFIATVFLIIVSFFSKAQTGIKEIKIGDSCPDITMYNIVNYKTKTAKISGFKNRLLILDFWATWCNPCVKALLVMDSLQKRFGDKIMILPVTNQDENAVQAFFDKMKNVLHITPVSVTGDTILNSLFEHTYLPHIVWIDRAGIVRAITGEQEVTADNIQSLLDNRGITMKSKKDENKNIDDAKPVFRVANPLINGDTVSLDSIAGRDLLYHSVITRYIKGIHAYETIRDSNRITAVNQPVANLYSVAAGRFQWELLMPNRQIVEIEDSILYLNITGQVQRTKEYVTGEQYNAWARENAVCYELELPHDMQQQRFAIMLKDLNTFFGSVYNIEGGLEKRKMKALVLKRTTVEDKLKTQGINKPYVQNAYFYGLYNEPFNYFTGDLRQSYQLNYALIDETGYTGKVDMELNCKLSDLQQLNKALEKYGLKFFEEDRDIDMIVIKEKQNAPSTAGPGN